ncbi:hypothetical protein [Cecembia lonarensis]|uniref:hypothetical protein n=1 Tax=Cecembia lonarensis TaxID=645110 RepID=UPI0003175C30|nr:hypothetical protein [Cecembia lonarensis]
MSLLTNRACPEHRETAYGGQLGRVSKHIIVKPVTKNPFLVDAAEDKAGALGQVCG